jgi:hypothetical protein
VLIEVELETVTDVRVLVSNVATSSGTVLAGIEFQFVPTVHSALVIPVQVPSTARAVFGANMASAPSQTLPSSLARLKATCAPADAIRIALPRIAAPGAAARVACERRRYERIPNPCGRLPPRFPIIARAVPRERTIAPRPTLRAEPVTINS